MGYFKSLRILAKGASLVFGGWGMFVLFTLALHRPEALLTSAAIEIAAPLVKASGLLWLATQLPALPPPSGNSFRDRLLRWADSL
jgi:hypothetical protein